MATSRRGEDGREERSSHRPRRPHVRGGRAQPPPSGRHRLHWHRRGSAPPGSRCRLVALGGRQPIGARAHHRETHGRCGRAGGRQERPLLTSASSPIATAAPGTRPAPSSAAWAPQDSPVNVETRRPVGSHPPQALLQNPKVGFGSGKGVRHGRRAGQDVFKCIEFYCNRQRMHSAIDYYAPYGLKRKPV